MSDPSEILANAYGRASISLETSLVTSVETCEQIELVCRCLSNRAVVRLLLACSLAKSLQPELDICKPYTEIGGVDSYSGRTFDESYIGNFITQHGLPCNSTTAFLTPALRNINRALTDQTELVGRPPEIYKAGLQLLAKVHSGTLIAEDLLAETVRWLLVIKAEKQERMRSILAGLEATKGASPFSVEAIVTLIDQHLKTSGASRLPVLVVSAAYEVAGTQIGERALPLHQHNAADKQTGAIGDLEITLIQGNSVVTGYEMKMRRVTCEDIDVALSKIASRGIQNYIFITTETIDHEVTKYAAQIYEMTDGIEVVVLSCIDFLRHFLHLFYRLRMEYINAYQNLVLSEPESAVSQPLKEAWLALRQVAESSRSDSHTSSEPML